jgi:uncharacterized protein
MENQNLENENTESSAEENPNTADAAVEATEGEDEGHKAEARPADSKDVKPKTPMEHWLKRQFPSFSLRGMLEALRLLEAGTPVPYIAFYSGDATNGLKSSDLYRLEDAKAEWNEISRKQQHLITEIDAAGKLDAELKNQIERSTDLDRLEDLYAPFKMKRQTLGNQAREAGLGVFADYLWNKAHGVEAEEIAGETLADKAAAFAKPDSKYADAEAVLKGVQDILVERISESFELRSLVRSTVFRRSKIRTTKGSKAKQNSKYSKFFDYQEPIGSLKKHNASHRYLAIRKGWMEDELTLSFERPDEGVLLEKFEEFAAPNKESIGAEVLVNAARLALKGSVFTVMENEAHRHLKEEAEKHVIETLGENLRKKLLRPGLGHKAVMGIDPGSANHPCSLALVDENGKPVLQLQFKLEEATDTNKQDFLASLENLKIEAIAVAHGPRSKEVREGFRKILEDSGKKLPILAVHEHTSSIYSSSPAAKEEFPGLDVNARRAIFVARYLQDPLAVILRLDPKFLSLGEFQHEVSHGKLRTGLNRAIEAAVNFAGVDPNQAPAHVLAKVAGFNAELAKAAVAARESAPFASREDLKKIAGLGETGFEYAAGFLRVLNSAEKLDHSFVHPKFYSAVKAYAAAQGAAEPFALNEEQLDAMEKDEALAEALGAANVHHIAYELGHEGEEPRGEFSQFEYDASLKSLADLKKDQAYPGVVTNVTSFGAFVDLGIEQDGLVHISELTDALSKNPFDSLFPGDVVTVWVSGVNEEKKQISLTMKDPSGKTARGERGRGRGRGGDRARGGRSRKEARAPELGPDGQPLPQVEGTEGGEGRGRGRGGRGGQRREREKRPDPTARNAPAPRPAGLTLVGEAPAPRPEREAREGGGERGERGGRGRGEGRGGPREEKKAPRKPQRDTKTGAIVKFDDDFGKVEKGGPRVAAKAKPHTFNPFANLGSLLNKGDKQEDK